MKFSGLFSDYWNSEESEMCAALEGPIFVIGASGFIGFNLYASLAARRNDVFAVSRSSVPSWRLATLPDSRRITMDVTKPSIVKTILKEYQPKTVFNLSAYGSYEQQNDVQQIHEVNYLGALNLIMALRESQCTAFVHTGSSSEYCLNCAAPNESGPFFPNSDYAVSKVAASYLIQYYGNFFQFPGVNLRLYSIYGPWEERSRLIPKLVSMGLTGKYPPLVNPEISRDFLYIDDCTHAIVRSALTICRTAPGISINIATGIKTPLRTIAKLSQKLFHIAEDPHFGDMPNRKWDLSNWYGNSDLARTSMHWQPRVSLTEGLQRTAQWEKLAQIDSPWSHVPSGQSR